MAQKEDTAALDWCGSGGRSRAPPGMVRVGCTGEIVKGHKDFGIAAMARAGGARVRVRRIWRRVARLTLLASGAGRGAGARAGRFTLRRNPARRTPGAEADG